MASLTLSIPLDLKRMMDHFPELNWSEVARKAIREKILVLERMNQLLSRSELTEKDALRYGRLLKKRIWEKHKHKR